MSKKPPSPHSLRNGGGFEWNGLTIAIPIVAGTLGGDYLDGYLHTKPLFILLGLLLGLIVGIFGAYRLYKAVFRS